MKTIYWSSTVLIALFLIWSAWSYIYSKPTIVGVRELGFPDFFRIQLAALKIIAVIILLLPQIPLPIKEWAYAGIGLFLITAIVAHTAHGDPFVITLVNIVLILVLLTSRFYLHQQPA